MNRPPIEIPSVDWFDYEVRAAAFRLLTAGTSDDIAAVVDETMAHPRLREIVHFLGLFGYGAYRELYGRVSVSVDEALALQLKVAQEAQDLQGRVGVPSDWLAEEPPAEEPPIPDG